MATIGRIIIALEAQYSQYQAGLQQAAAQLESFKRAEEQAKSSGSIFDSLAVGAGIGVGLKAIEAVGEAFHEVASAAEEGARATARWVAEAVEAADAAWKLASALQVPTDQLMGLAAIAKTEADQGFEDFAATLKHLEKNLGEAAIAGGPAADALERMGLSARDVASMRPDEAFLKLADAISHVQNAAEQHKDIDDLFGKSGANLLPMIREGAAGLEEGIAKAKAFGVALSDVDAAKLHLAKDGAEELGLKFEGLKNQLALSLAPTIIALEKQFSDLIPPADEMQSAFTSALRSVATGVGHTWDMLDKGKEIFLRTGVVAADFAEAVLIPIGEIQKAYHEWEGTIAEIGKAAAFAFAPQIAGFDALTAKAREYVGIMNSALTTDEFSGSSAGRAAQEVEKWRQKMEAAADVAHKAQSHVGEVQRWFDQITEAADKSARDLAKVKNDSPFAGLSDGLGEQAKKITDILAGMQRDVDTFGMTAGQIKLFDLDAMGATEAQKAIARMLEAQREMLDQQKKMKDEADKLNEAGRSPMEKYQQDIQHLKDLFDKQLLNPEGFNAAVAKANKELLSAAGGTTPAKVAAESRRFDFDVNTDQPTLDPLKQIEAQTKRQADAVDLSNQYLAEIYRFQNNADRDSTATIDFLF